MALELNNPPSTPSASAKSSGLSWQFNRPSKIGTKDRLFFTERLALLLETGVNLHAALRALEKQSDNPAMIVIIEALIEKIGEGQSFSHALSQYPQVFSKTYTNLIAASENGGFMPQVLEELLEMEEKRERLRSTLVSSLSYPAFLVFFSLSVVIFVLIVVFPKFAAMFDSIRDQLPASTLILMWMSEILQSYWWAMMGGLSVAVLGLRQWLKGHGGSAWLDRLKLGMPVIKDVFVQLYLVQSLRVMSLSLKNGVGIVDALAACKEVVTNSVYQRFITTLEVKVQEGGGLAPGFAEARFIPAIVQQMISTGEETGNLSKVLARIADFYERELSKKLTALSKTAEPVMLLVMGVVVGILVSSLILPIFKLSRAVY
jgi:type II secretory pathway component PulF